MTSSQLKASILAHLQQQTEQNKQGSQESSEEQSIDNVNLVKIPSIGEFGQLLDIVAPKSSNGLFWKQEDLILKYK